jgi:ABC-type siderophore export system fused ATPase/permease subunit
MQLKCKDDLKFKYKISYLIIWNIRSLNSPNLLFFPVVGYVFFSSYKNLFTVYNVSHKIGMLLCSMETALETDLL